jgi:hypothetical protein
METRYFVKFIGDKNVTLAVAYKPAEVEMLRRNHYEETTQSFYQWVQQHTHRIG